MMAFSHRDYIGKTTTQPNTGGHLAVSTKNLEAPIFSLIRYGFAVVIMFFVLPFCLLFLGSFGLTLYKIGTYCKVEGAIFNSDIIRYRNKRGTWMYSMSCNADYVVGGRKYSTTKISPIGNISSNFEMLVKWNYQSLLDKTAVSVYCNPKDSSDSFVFYTGKIVRVAILICCLLIVTSIVVIRNLSKFLKDNETRG